MVSYDRDRVNALSSVIWKKYAWHAIDGAPQWESMMELFDIFQSVKAGIGWKTLRNWVIDQSGIQGD